MLAFKHMHMVGRTRTNAHPFLMPPTRKSGVRMVSDDVRSHRIHIYVSDMHLPSVMGMGKNGNALSTWH